LENAARIHGPLSHNYFALFRLLHLTKRKTYALFERAEVLWKGNKMKTHLFALAVVVAIVASVCNASCVKSSLKAMGRVNVALNGGR